MTQKQADVIHSWLMDNSLPVGRCWGCNVPVYANVSGEKPICMDCLALHGEYLRISDEEFRTVEWIRLPNNRGSGDRTDTGQLVAVQVPQGGPHGVVHILGHDVLGSASTAI